MSLKTTYSEDGYSQDSDFDSDSALSYSSCESNESNGMNSIPQSPAHLPETVSKNDANINAAEINTSRFIIREDLNNGRESPIPKPKKNSTYTLSRLQQLSKPRPQFDLPIPPPNNKKEKKATRQSYANFVERQEALEKLRQSKRSRKKLELDYEAKVNKRKCPRCGNVQSFDEYNGNKLKCPLDGSTYKFPAVFSIKSFERRMFLSRCRKQQTIDIIRGERIMTLEKGQQKSKSSDWKNSSDSFLMRMRDDLLRRKEKLHQLRLERR